jgi:glucose-6-phosphate isomerase
MGRLDIPYTHNVDDCLAEEIGDGGITSAELERYIRQADFALGRIRGEHAAGRLPILDIPAKRDDLEEIRRVADRFRISFDNVIVLGTGGSSLAGQALCSLLGIGFAPRSGAPHIHFMDNVDPETFNELIAGLNWPRVGLIVISKSGSTAETLMQFGVLLEAMSARVSKQRIADQVVVVTENVDNPLRTVSRDLGCCALEHDARVGGRYSVLSVTGILPAAIGGLDIEAIRAGAETLVEPILSGIAAEDYPPALGAALSVGLSRQNGVNATVLMTYSDRLAAFGRWYCQLWAESTGKNGEGTLPVSAIGTTDQHSQLQLYLDGPTDKMFSLLLTDTVGQGAGVPSSFSDIDSLSYLRNQTMGDLLSVSGHATVETLANNGRPVRVLEVPNIDEKSMGALMMHFMIETIISADLIGVNAFNQPAVEEGKILARHYLSKESGG